MSGLSKPEPVSPGRAVGVVFGVRVFRRGMEGAASSGDGEDGSPKKTV